MPYLTFKNLNIAAFILAVFLGLLGVDFIFFVLLFLLHGGISYWGTTQISSQFHLPSHYRAKDITTKKIALSFDDSISNPKQTAQILDILKQYNAPATFFCIGRQLEQKEQKKCLERIDQEGHLIGNHTYSHSNWFDFFGAKKVAAELEKTDALIFSILGKKPLFFRPPYGITNPNIAKALRSSSHQVIGWSLRSLDTVISDEKKLLKRVQKKLQKGDIILLHDHLPQTTLFLPLFLEYLLKEGYTISPLNQLLGIEPYS